MRRTFLILLLVLLCCTLGAFDLVVPSSSDGFYLLLAGDYGSADIVPLMTEMFSFIASFEGEIPGASPKDCGNWLDMNLPMARYLAKKYLDEVLTDIQECRLTYPE